MKSTKNIFMLLAFLAVWVLVGFRLLSFYKPNEDVSTIIESDTELMVEPQLAFEDDFTLNLRVDPFTGEGFEKEKPKQIIKEVLSTTVSKSTQLEKNKPKENVIIPPLPSIQYQGIMKDPSSEKIKALLTINGAFQMVSLGDSVGSGTVQGFNQDSICLIIYGQKLVEYLKM